MKKKKNGRWLRAAALVLAAVCLLSAGMSPALAVSQAEIDALKDDASDLKGQKKEIQAKLNALAADKSNAMERKDLLDQQIANTSAQITNVEAQISKYAQLIGEKETELKEAEEQEAAQYELFCQRVRAMEKRGSVSYWSVLFKAESFTDLLSRVDFINEIMASDQRVIDDLQTLQQQIEDCLLYTSKIAGSMAFKEACRKADPTLQEPIMKVSVIVPDEYMGDVIGDLNSRRGQIVKLEARSGAQQIDANVPLAEMFGYATDLRSRTQGRGQYTMEPSHYVEIPKNIRDKIVETRTKPQA